MARALHQLTGLLHSILTKRELWDPSVVPLLELLVIRVFEHLTYSRDWLLHPITVAFHDLFGYMVATTEGEPKHCKEVVTEKRVRSSWDLLCAMVDDGILDEQLKMLEGGRNEMDHTATISAVAMKVMSTAQLMTCTSQLDINLASLDLPHAAEVARALFDVPARALPSLPRSRLAAHSVFAALQFIAACVDAKLDAMLGAAACPGALLADDGSRLSPMRMHPALAGVRLMECALTTINAKPVAHSVRAPVVKRTNIKNDRQSYKPLQTSTEQGGEAEQDWMGKVAGLAYVALHWLWHHGEGAQPLLRQAGPMLAALLRKPASLVPMSSQTHSKAHTLVVEMTAQDDGRATAIASALLEAEATNAGAPCNSARARKQKQQRSRIMSQLPAHSPEPAPLMRQDSSNMSRRRQDVSSLEARPGPAPAHPPDGTENSEPASHNGSTGSEAPDGARHGDEASSAQPACQDCGRRSGRPMQETMLLGSAVRPAVTDPQGGWEAQVPCEGDHNLQASSTSSGGPVLPATSQVSRDNGGQSSGQAANSWLGSAVGTSTSAPGSAGSAASQAREASSWHACLQLDPMQLLKELCCPITQELLQDPVIAADGHTYERRAIQAWLTKTATSPMTGLPLEHGNPIPNVPLQHFLQKHMMCCGHDAG